MAVISKGITLSYQKTGETEFTILENLMEIPELGGEVEAIEVTTLGDVAHVYTDGLINYGDSLGFKFLYDTEQYEVLIGLTGESVRWDITLPDETACMFTGKPSVKLDGVGTNAALTYTLSIKPETQMGWNFA